ncbi:hypothetical protein SAMN04489723_11047 [Algoriphagus aquimarinus]|uniref:Uncharacterized protein n=1 Tax=Algoriphagus aquimarinus TaxID=237018 RepID=A0A1I1B159_9BACT|nr:hypothetical protein SAMN04489723_11047 [Algoriphagus aquimarinus]
MLLYKKQNPKNNLRVFEYLPVKGLQHLRGFENLKGGYSHSIVAGGLEEIS